MNMALTYAIYLTLSVGLTIWVAKTLVKNGRVFLVDVFHGDEAMADSVNHLLQVGFYLINLGYVCLELKIDAPVNGLAGSIEALAVKMGTVLLVLGGMHFFNLFLFTKVRGSALAGRRQAATQSAYGQNPAYVPTPNYGSYPAEPRP